MNRRFFIYLSISATILAGLILTITFLSDFKQHSNEVMIAHNDVKGMAVKYQEVLYTLNFEQQKQVIEALNDQKRIDSINFGVPFIDCLIIYLFNQPDQTIDFNSNSR